MRGKKYVEKETKEKPSFFFPYTSKNGLTKIALPAIYSKKLACIRLETHGLTLSCLGSGYDFISISSFVAPERNHFRFRDTVEKADAQ